MKTQHLIFIVLMVASLLMGCENKKKAHFLHKASFIVVDEVTNKRVNVSLQLDTEQLNGLSPLADTEMSVGGPYRVTWVTSTGVPGRILLRADGYNDTEVPESHIETISTQVTVAGDHKPSVIQMSPKE